MTNSSQPTTFPCKYNKIDGNLKILKQTIEWYEQHTQTPKIKITFNELKGNKKKHKNLTI